MNLILRPQEKELKTWTYSEKNKKHKVDHTIVVTNKRFIHNSELNEAKQSYKDRTELSVKQIKAVNAFYGKNKKFGGAIFCFILALLCLAVGALGMLKKIELDPTISYVALGACALFAIIAVALLFRKKISFGLAIDYGASEHPYAISYGKVTIDTSDNKKKKKKKKKSTYKFTLTQEVANEIVDIIGALIV